MGIVGNVIHLVDLGVGMLCRLRMVGGVVAWSPGHVLGERRMRGSGVRNRVRVWVVEGGVWMIHEAGN